MRALLRPLLSFSLAALLLTTAAGSARGQAPAAASSTSPTPAVAETGGRVPDIFEDVTQLERVEPNTTREIIRRFQAENPSPREYAPNLASQGYEQDDSNPALKLEKISVGPEGVLMELSGLSRSRNSVSAVMRRDTLRLKNSKGQTAELVAFEGVTELRDRRGGSALVVNPGDKLFLLFGKFDDSFAYSLSHVNRDNRESVYFAQIDPRFSERYEAMYAAANTPLGMKDFVVEFARNDPKNRVLPVFSRLLGQARALNTFEGFHMAFQLLGEPRDYAGMQRTALTAEHKAVIQSIEAEKQAEVRRREEARLAEVRRQEAIVQEQQRAEQARLAEQRCLATPACVREMEARKEACVQSIRSCRAQCDRLTGSGSYGSFFANLAAAGMAAACSRGCKCDNNFGDLLAKFNDMSAGSSPAPKQSAGATATAQPGAAVPQRRAEEPAPAKAAQSTRRTEETASTKAAPAAVDHVCSVNCRGPDGKASITVKAGSPAEAASLVDPRGHDVCRAAGHKGATDIRMDASQCRRKPS